MRRSTIFCVHSGDQRRDRALVAALSDLPGLQVAEVERPGSSPSEVARLVRHCLKHSPLALVSAELERATSLAAWICGVPVCLEWSAELSPEPLAEALLERLRRGSAQSGLPLFVKRAFDVSVAAFALAAAAPLLGASAAAVRLSLGAPVFFRQERPGKGGQLFRIYKLRTMSMERGPDGQLLPDEQRLVGAGRWIRRASLDELPQLLNVALGEMSLVGPRPLLRQYLERYSAHQARRHNVLPGITGLAQVNGRNATSWVERLEYDIDYVDSWSLLLDAKILWKTLGTLLRAEGVSQEGHATMPEFQGEQSAPPLKA